MKICGVVAFTSLLLAKKRKKMSEAGKDDFRIQYLQEWAKPGSPLAAGLNENSCTSQMVRTIKYFAELN